MSNCLYCGKENPSYREKNITCSKKCSNAWNWLPKQERERRRGKKYNSK
jgi:predicted nucleic acid-binding Zn ribbon protein